MDISVRSTVEKDVVIKNGFLRNNAIDVEIRDFRGCTSGSDAIVNREEVQLVAKCSKEALLKGLKITGFVLLILIASHKLLPEKQNLFYQFLNVTKHVL